MLCWTDHDSHVPGPYHQVSGLRLRDAVKFIDSRIKIVRACVFKGKTSTPVNIVDQVRTIHFCRRALARFQCSAEYRKPVVWSKKKQLCLSCIACRGKCGRRGGLCYLC